MIKSMTGFGRCEITEGQRKFTVELKGVNHRYLDVNIRMPKKLNFFETSIRNLLKQYAQRGKVDILDELFGYTINNGKGKPTNSEFIALVADTIRLEQKHR